MKVLGISGSPRKSQTTERLVKVVLDATGLEYELISLHSKRIGPCICCLRCVKDNWCKVEDDYLLIMEKIYRTDAMVIGASNYFGHLNALTHALLERLYCFRHDANGEGGMKLAGKLGVIISVGGGMPDIPVSDIKGFFDYNKIETIGSVWARGAVACFSCGFGETCSISGFRMFYGQNTKMAPELIPSLDKQPEVIEKAKELGVRLRHVLLKK